MIALKSASYIAGGLLLSFFGIAGFIPSLDLTGFDQVIGSGIGILALFAPSLAEFLRDIRSGGGI